MSKILVKDLPLNVFDIYTQIPIEGKRHFLTSYSYIIEMSKTFDVDIPPEDAMKLFNTTLMKFPEKNEINRQLFLLLKEKPIVPPENVVSTNVPISDNFNKILSDIFTNKRSNEIQSIKEVCDSHRRNIQSYMQNYRTELAGLKSQNEKITLLEKHNYETSKNKIAAELNKIYSDKDLEHVVFDDKFKTLYMVTAKDCISKYLGETKNFGKFCIAYNIESNDFHVYPFERNITNTAGNQFHAHFHADFRVCFGNAAASYEDLRSDYDIHNIVVIINMIAHQYNPDSPILRWEGFDQSRLFNMKNFIDQNYNRLQRIHPMLRLKEVKAA